MSDHNKELRRRILEKGRESGLVHYSSSFSCLDFVSYLHDSLMGPHDTFILSKGHASMALYAVLEKKGLNPPWEMHPEYNPTQGIHATTGSLGHGLPIGLGYALAHKLKEEPGRVYVLVGDGEISEGTNWEALSLAHKLNVNLTLAVDYNKHQIGGDPRNISGVGKEELVKRLEAFGCDTISIEGHNREQFEQLKSLKTGLQAVVLDTTPGKGVSFLERTQPHHYDFNKDEQQYKKALEELE